MNKYANLLIILLVIVYLKDGTILEFPRAENVYQDSKWGKCMSWVVIERDGSKVQRVVRSIEFNCDEVKYVEEHTQ